MDVKLKLYKPFVAEVNRLRTKYGEEFERINGFHNTNLNFGDFIDNFISEDTLADATIDSNSNSSLKNISAMIKEMTKPFTKLLSYNKIYYEMVKKYGIEDANKWLEMEWNGTLYMHDSHTSSMMPYCYNFDLKDIAEKGLFFMPNLNAKGAEHWETFNNHLIEFTAYASGQQAGAVGLASYLIEAFYFYKKDKEEEYLGITDWDKYKKQQFQVFVYNINQEYLRTNEPSFTNITMFDREYLVGLFGDRQYKDGTYVVDYIEDIIQFQKDFMDVVSQIREKQVFTFPVISFSLLYQDGKFVDEEFAKWAVDHNTKWMDANFYIGNDITVLSSCCRLANNIEDVNKKLTGHVSSIGGSSVSIGSAKVSTQNLMRVALLSNKDEDKFFSVLKEITEINIKALDVQRGIMKRNIEKGLLPMYTYDLMKLENQFQTIGINGAYNAVKYMGHLKIDELGNEHWTEKGIEFMEKILNFINFKKDDNDFSYSFNQEFIPAERCSVVNCFKDKQLFPNENIDTNLYANQYIDLRAETPLNERIKLAGLFDHKCGGGNILHVNVESQLGFDKSWEMINYIAKNKVVYFAFTTKLKVCKNSHTFVGSSTCPECGLPADKEYQRIVGYYTPTKSWSKDRKIESSERKWYELNED